MPCPALTDAVCCDREAIGRPLLCLGHMTALEELTISGGDGDSFTRDFFRQLAQLGVEPALPPTLKVLRLGEPRQAFYPFVWGAPPLHS